MERQKNDRLGGGVTASSRSTMVPRDFDITWESTVRPL
jgi:hypothetical protein